MSDIWNGTNIPVLGVTGEYASGKTLLISSIDPEHTCIIDLEESSATYGGIPFAKRHDLQDMLVGGKGTPKPVDIFIWFRDLVEKIKPGEYTVLAVDPINDLEQGLVDWVAANPKEFGRSAGQYERAGGILWGDVKAYWKRLLMQIAAKVKTFAFATHMGFVWSGSSPTTRRKAKGKDTLFELASMYLQVERKPDANGKMPDVPTAIVLKSRLAVTHMVEGEVIHKPILPPRLKQATPKAIRDYIANPPDYTKLKAHEKAVPETLSDDEKLLLKSEIAANEAESERMKAERAERAKAAAESLRDRQASTTTKATEAEAVANETNKTNGTDPRHSLAQQRLRNAIHAGGIKHETLAPVLEKRGVTKIDQLTWEQAEEIAEKLEEKQRKKLLGKK
jgi:hypothetical protein